MTEDNTQGDQPRQYKTVRTERDEIGDDLIFILSYSFLIFVDSAIVWEGVDGGRVKNRQCL